MERHSRWRIEIFEFKLWKWRPSWLGGWKNQILVSIFLQYVLAAFAWLVLLISSHIEINKLGYYVLSRISVPDFVNNFHTLHICHMGPDCIQEINQMTNGNSGNLRTWSAFPIHSSITDEILESLYLNFENGDDSGLVAAKTTLWQHRKKFFCLVFAFLFLWNILQQWKDV